MLVNDNLFLLFFILLLFLFLLVFLLFLLKDSCDFLRVTVLFLRFIIALFHRVVIPNSNLSFCLLLFLWGFLFLSLSRLLYLVGTCLGGGLIDLLTLFVRGVVFDFFGNLLFWWFQFLRRFCFFYFIEVQITDFLLIVPFK